MGCRAYCTECEKELDRYTPAEIILGIAYYQCEEHREYDYDEERRVDIINSLLGRLKKCEEALGIDYTKEEDLY